jgi:hypothetical protein
MSFSQLYTEFKEDMLLFHLLLALYVIIWGDNKTLLKPYLAVYWFGILNLFGRFAACGIKSMVFFILYFYLIHSMLALIRFLRYDTSTPEYILRLVGALFVACSLLPIIDEFVENTWLDAYFVGEHDLANRSRAGFQIMISFCDMFAEKRHSLYVITDSDFGVILFVFCFLVSCFFLNPEILRKSYQGPWVHKIKRGVSLAYHWLFAPPLSYAAISFIIFCFNRSSWSLVPLEFNITFIEPYHHIFLNIFACDDLNSLLFMFLIYLWLIFYMIPRYLQDKADDYIDYRLQKTKGMFFNKDDYDDSKKK